MRYYAYVVVIEDGDQQEHRLEGSLTTERGDIGSVANEAMGLSFRELTGGYATYGKPGEGGCRGPYKFKRMEIVQT